MSADELEARSLAYVGQRIVRLSSGRLALFDHWTNDDGMPLLKIGTLADLEPLVTPPPKPQPKIKVDLLALIRADRSPLIRRF